MPDRLVVAQDGAIPVSLGAIGYAAIVVGDGAAGIELDRLIVVLDGTVELAFALIGGRANDEDGGKIPPRIGARLNECRAAADYGVERWTALAFAGGHLLLGLCMQ